MENTLFLHGIVLNFFNAVNGRPAQAYLAVVEDNLLTWCDCLLVFVEIDMQPAIIPHRDMDV